MTLAVFDTDGISKAHCSCPVGSGEDCKHVAALLLAWMHRPGDFREIEELDVILERQNKKELIALIKQMILRRPELEVLLETPLPTSGKRHTPVDPETYRRQVADAFRHVGYDWGADADITDELESIIKIGDGFLDQEDHASASTIYQAVAEEVLSHYDTFEDEGGELCGVVNDCVEGLGRCLETNDDATRERIMRALFDIYRFDVDFGGVGLGDDVSGIIIDYATSDERRTVVDWVQASILPKEKNDWSSNWHQQVYGGFFLNLRREELDDEAFLHICRETRLNDLI